MAEINSQANSTAQTKKKSSLGSKCAAFGCYNFQYKKDGTRTGLHFFTLPQKNPAKSHWCNLIKRRDGFDGFKVTTNTVLCEEHFKATDIKQNPLRWMLVAGAVSSLKLYVDPKTTTTRMTRKAPKDRTPFLDPQPCSSTESDTCCLPDVTEEEHLALPDITEEEESSFSTCAAQTDFSFVKTPVYLDDADVSSHLMTDHCYAPPLPSNEQREYVNFQQKID